MKRREICNTYICIYIYSSSSSITRFQNSKIPAFFASLGIDDVCLKNRQSCALGKVWLGGMLHFAFKGLERENFVWRQLVEKNWNFGIFRVKMAKKLYESSTCAIPI